MASEDVGIPLVEAIFEAQVAQSPGWSQLSQATLKGKLQGEFGGPEEVLEPVGVQFSLSDKGIAQQMERHPPRLRLWTKNRGQMFQFDERMCAYNLMGDYTHFEDHAERLRELLETYLAEARPLAVDWLGQRYINRVELPATGVNPSDVFSIYPRLPQAAEHRPFAMQVVFDSSEDGDVVVGLNFQGLQGDKALYFLDFYIRSKVAFPPDAGAIVAWHARAHQPVRRAFSMAFQQQSSSREGRHP